MKNQSRLVLTACACLFTGILACGQNDTEQKAALPARPATPSPQAAADPEKPKPENAAKPEKPEQPDAAFDPSNLIPTAAQRQKAQWALLGKLLAESDPTTLSATQADLALSPTSLVNALQVLWWGTRGETALEVAKLLDIKPGKEDPALAEVPAGNPQPDQKKDGSLGGSATLSLGSGLWFNEAFPVKEEYQKLLRERGLGTAEAIDWANTEAAVGKVNQWCSEATGGKIGTLFQPGDIRPPVSFVLASVISFKGSWAQSFDPASTQEGDFTLLNGEKTPASFLTSTRKTRFAALEDGTKLLELPFAAGHQRLVAVLPAKEGAKELAKLEKVIPGKVSDWLGKLAEAEVAISLPKFDVTGEVDPAKALQALGVKRVFSDKLADFSGASETQGLKLDVIRHQAVVSIDEQGAEAAGATGAAVTMKSLEKTPEFAAARPFLFFILGDDGDLLFAGRVASPTKKATASAGIDQPAK